ncbi:MAG: FkbM family methyltransferase [Ardenticatenales bacterium]|nr:FkbM family methyltransferase [Ardenticatenales bacterium]
MSNVQPLGQHMRIAVAGSDEQLDGAAYRISLPAGGSFDLMIDANERDGISSAIADGSFILPDIFALLPALCPTPGRVLDLGAHIGTFALYAAALGHEVLAVEASARNAALLRASIALNGYDQIRVAEAAISNREGTLEFIQAGPYGLVANPHFDHPTTSVRAATASQLLKEAGWAQVNFIKMDIEGSEVKGVLGMVDLLGAETGPPILYESNGGTLRHFGQTPQTLMGALHALGYDCLRVYGDQLVPVDAFTWQPDVVAELLAVKATPQRAAPWTVRKNGFSSAELAQMAAHALAHSYEDDQLWVARSLGEQAGALLLDAQFRGKAAEAQQGGSERVRKALGWLEQSSDATGGGGLAALSRLRKLLERE